MQAAEDAREIPIGTKGPDDDFYCLKYQVWYRVADCVYRGRNRTYPGCVDCLQGYVNIRSALNGTRPPVTLDAMAARREGNLTPSPAPVLPLTRGDRRSVR